MADSAACAVQQQHLPAAQAQFDSPASIRQQLPYCRRDFRRFSALSCAALHSSYQCMRHQIRQADVAFVSILTQIGLVSSLTLTSSDLAQGLSGLCQHFRFLRLAFSAVGLRFSLGSGLCGFFQIQFTFFQLIVLIKDSWLAVWLCQDCLWPFDIAPSYSLALPSAKAFCLAPFGRRLFFRPASLAFSLAPSIGLVHRPSGLRRRQAPSAQGIRPSSLSGRRLAAFVDVSFFRPCRLVLSSFLA